VQQESIEAVVHVTMRMPDANLKALCKINTKPSLRILPIAK